MFWINNNTRITWFCSQGIIHKNQMKISTFKTKTSRDIILGFNLVTSGNFIIKLNWTLLKFWTQPFQFKNKIFNLSSCPEIPLPTTCSLTYLYVTFPDVLLFYFTYFTFLLFILGFHHFCHFPWYLISARMWFLFCYSNLKACYHY